MAGGNGGGPGTGPLQTAEYCIWEWAGDIWIETYHGCTGGEAICPAPLDNGAFIGEVREIMCQN
jgi:hypothetical protein